MTPDQFFATASSAKQQRTAHGRIKANSPAKTHPTGGPEDRPSARPPFPTIAGATGVKYGRPPKVLGFSGLKTPTQLPATIIGFPDRIDGMAEDMRLNTIRCSGVQ